MTASRIDIFVRAGISGYDYADYSYGSYDYADYSDYDGYDGYGYGYGAILGGIFHAAVFILQMLIGEA